MLDKIKKIEELKNKLNGLRPLSYDELERLKEEFMIEYTYDSNAIEGSTLSINETFALLFDTKHCNIENASPREIYEAINHKYALNFVLNELIKKENLEANDIIHINELINRNIKDTSGYRKVNVRIRGSQDIPPNANQIPMKMLYFIDNYNRYPLQSEDDVFYKIAKFHIEFEHIHPFEDGNGRTGRLLINYEMLKNNLVPIVIPIDRRQEYFGFISNYDEEGLKNLLKELSSIEKDRIEKFKNMLQY